MSTNVRRTIVLALVLAGGTTLAEAQATRTWVSGVGDDANPCSRTAPCKTFAGAISKTAPKGEINVLDPGGFGGVTITKSISIIADNFLGGVLVSGTNAIVVNAAAADIVVLRGLDINGMTTGLNGIRFLNGAELHVENCQIYGFVQKGISVEAASPAQVFIKNTRIHNAISATGGGILLARTGIGSVAATLDNVRTVSNRYGVRVEDGARAVVRNSEASGNNTNGYIAVGAAAFLTLENSVANDNINNGVLANTGAVVRISNVVVTGNGTGLNSSGGSIVSFGNNRIAGNGTDGAPSSTVGQQ